MTIRNFDDWNKEKKKINDKENPKFFIKPRQIWFTKMGENVGFEENGKDHFLRPVLVIKKIGNMFFTVALTSRGKGKNYFYHKLEKLTLKNPKYLSSSFVILSQVKVMDKKRFTEHVGSVTTDEFDVVIKKLRTRLF
ncbi:MAG: mRNA interferase MazF [Crocinitomicaceae bacterium]|jgi:mRNA interferase MazF